MNDILRSLLCALTLAIACGGDDHDSTTPTDETYTTSGDDEPPDERDEDPMK